MSYITEADVNTFLGTSWETTLIDMLISMAESALNTELRIDGLSVDDYTEYYEVNDFGFFVLKQIQPNSVTSINDVAVSSSDYLLEGRKLTLSVNYTADKWNRIKIIYNAGYATTPQDVKTMMLHMVSWLYNARKWVGIKSFTQWQLSVSFSSQTELDTFSMMYKAIISKYKKNDIYS